MKFTVIVFPGTNCDHDCFFVLSHVLEQEVSYVWHKESDLGETDCVILPGGFSYGDYLRTGSIARFSPIMEAVIEFANKGGLVLGICNGFQILLESGLLPGAMLRNTSLRFVCKDVRVRVERTDTPFTMSLEKGQVLTIPVAHMEGNYFASNDDLKSLNKGKQVLFRYCDHHGELTRESNPNGSLENIAGIMNGAGNVCGMMPHPERCAEDILGNTDGQYIFRSLIEWFMSKIPA